MSKRSIVDRVLLVAATVCAAGLAWQLTVLMTSKGPAPSGRKLEAAAASSPSPVVAASPADNAAPAATPVRVVYADGSAQKSVGKASDLPEGTPVALASPAMMRSPSPASPAPAQPSPVVQAVAAAVPSAVVTGGAAAGAAEPHPDDAAPAVAEAPKVAALVPATPAKPPLDTDAKPAPSQGGVSLNHASVDALNRLTGAGRIGQTIARHRPYRSVEDLLTKRVVRRSVYDQIKGQLAAD